MRTLLRTLTFTAAAFSCVAAQAQAPANYPNQPVKLIVPFAAGGTTDALARLLAQRLTAAWGQQVIVDNRPGASATLGSNTAAKAPADGYTLLIGSTHQTIAQNVFKNLPYDIGRDFIPVGMIAMVPNVVVVNANVPAKNIQELISLTKSQPGKLAYASVGSGSAHHLIGEMIKLRSNIDLLHVPYKGSSPAVTDLIGNQVQVMFDTVTSALPYIKAGKTRALAVTTAKRSSALPNVPTLAETTLPGFDAGTWFGVLAPKDTPSAISDKIRTDIGKVLSVPEVQQQLLKMGAEPMTGGTQAQMVKMIKSELSSYEAVVKQINLKIE